MQPYAKLLIAVDLSSESEQVLRKARQLAGSGVESHLVYVQEPMDNVYVGVVPQSAAYGGLGELEAHLREEYLKKLNDLGETYAIPEGNRHILNGAPSREIHQFAEDHQIDLIIIGTHGQKGLQLLLGSTANSVLHGAKCDVLSVRITAN